MSSSNKSITFHLITLIPDFAIGFVSPEKEKHNTLEKSDGRKVDTCIGSAYEESKFVNLILRGKGVIKTLIDN